MRSGPLGLIACGSGSLPVALLCESKKGMSACEIQRGVSSTYPPKRPHPGINGTAMASHLGFTSPDSQVRVGQLFVNA